MKKLLLMTLLSSTILVACNSKTEIKSALDTVTAQKLVDEGNRAFEGYVSKGDSVGLATNSYTIDAKFMAPNMVTAERRPAIISAVAGIINAGITGMKLTSKEIWVNEKTITETICISKLPAPYKIEDQTFLLGTDGFGRDVYSRIVLGSRVSLAVGIVAVLVSLFLIGTALGLIAGYYRGKTDIAISWFINVIWSLPSMLLVAAISFALGKGFWQIFVAIGISSWVEVARVVRGQVFSLREKEFIQRSEERRVGKE